MNGNLDVFSGISSESRSVFPGLWRGRGRGGEGSIRHLWGSWCVVWAVLGTGGQRVSGGMLWWVKEARVALGNGDRGRVGKGDIQAG